MRDEKEIGNAVWAATFVHAMANPDPVQKLQGMLSRAATAADTADQVRAYYEAEMARRAESEAERIDAEDEFDGDDTRDAIIFEDGRHQ